MGKYPNSGIISANPKKQQDSHPDYKGSAEVNDVEYWISGWKNTSSKDGSTYLRLTFQPKDQQGQRQQSGGSREPAGDDPF